ncbi:MAG: PASTA domain-containing protein, partial [Phycisphaerae bacterium]|nr:PASTA domain-containing protein [Phycisphaerae bacterium]
LVKEAELTCRIEHRLTQDEREVDRVLHQHPDAGQFRTRNKAVRLTVGMRAVAVPDVVGAPQGEARAALADHDLKMQVCGRRITGRFDVGTVIQQKPAAGKLARVGSCVDVTIEAESVVVPSLRDLTLEEARRQLDGRLIAKPRREVLRDDVRVPRVEGQDPPPHRRVAPGTVVHLDLAVPGVRVPQCVGRPEADARKQLRGLGLQCTSAGQDSSDVHAQGTVMRQHPDANALVAPGSAVRITVSSGPPPRVVPSVIRNDLPDARRRLKDAGFESVMVHAPEGQHIPPLQEFRYYVINQDPAGGQTVHPRTVITLSVAKPVE